MSIHIRPPADAQEIRSIEDIQQHTWQMGDRALVPFHVWHAWQHAGGLLLCAFDEDRMVGFAGAFIGEREGKKLLWSHMTAVLPDYRGQGIGKQLKYAQREHALALGYNSIAWTFDPLRKLNACLNLHTLGAKVSALHAELYGKLEDGINRGLLSDRFEVIWNLKSEPQHHSQTPEQYILRANAEMQPILDDSPLQDTLYGIQLPTDIESLRGTIHAWNYALRDAVKTVLEAGYSIDDVHDEGDTFTYIANRPPAWYLYMLETKDSSLYTGITTDLSRRVAEHNAGRGAKYTSTRRPVKLVAAWETYGRAKASQLEHKLKQRTRPKKLALIQDPAANFYDAKRLSLTE